MTPLELLRQLLTKSLLEKVELRQVTVTVSNTREFDLSICLFRLHHLAAQSLSSLHSIQRENGKVAVEKRRVFDRLHSMTIVSHGVKKCDFWTG